MESADRDRDGVGRERFVDVNTFEFTEAHQNINTKRATESHMRLFLDWLKKTKEDRKPEEISPKELDLYLAQFILGVRKDADAELNDPVRQYEPLTLVAMHSSIHRYLSAKGYNGNIKADDAFRHSRDVLAAKQKELKQLGKGNKPRAAQPFTEEEIDTMFSLNILGSGMLIIDSPDNI